MCGSILTIEKLSCRGYERLEPAPLVVRVYELALFMWCPIWTELQTLRCEPVEARVRSVQIKVDPLGFDGLASVAIAAEEMLVEALVPQAPVE